MVFWPFSSAFTWVTICCMRVLTYLPTVEVAMAPSAEDADALDRGTVGHGGSGGGLRPGARRQPKAVANSAAMKSLEFMSLEPG